ncbi:uncharacterized protein Dvar_41170 [Desulfosarcina variabilis str. Montpellier]|uniref:porin n=1 Tax=Desulfosarcina variabilis TaxID=2300 RepID=UPI003AFA627C
MKNWFVVFLAVSLVVAMTVPAAAEPNLSIKGEYVVQGFHAEGVFSQNQGLAETLDEDELDYVYQRFRLAPTFKASDNVSAHLRFDFAEGMWGHDQDFDTNRAGDTSTNNDDSEIQVDRAYVDVDTTWLRVRAGLQFFPVGQTQVFRDNEPGLQFDIKTGTPFGIRLGWIKAWEGIGSGTDSTRLFSLRDETPETKDQDRYLAVLGWKSDTFAANIFGVKQSDSGHGATPNGTGFDYNNQEEPHVFGLRVRMDLGALAVHGEVAQFGGELTYEETDTTVDYTGTQVNVNGMFNISDALKVGLDLFYSSAAGDNEKKITSMGNPFASYDIRNGGSMGWDTETYGRANGFLFSSVIPPGPLPGDVFDPYLQGTGSKGAGVGAMYTMFEKLSLIGQFHYMVADDDDLTGVTGEFEKGYNLLAAAVYPIAPKTTLHATYQRVDASFMDDIDPDPSNVYSLWMRVLF